MQEIFRESWDDLLSIEIEIETDIRPDIID
jgi:hypothetical protein